MHLVDLVSQTEKETAWWEMMQRMIDEENIDAWAVKLADMIHNLSECHHCTLEQRKGYLFIKAPLFVYYGNKYFADHPLYKEFLETYWSQVKSFYGYFQ